MWPGVWGRMRVARSRRKQIVYRQGKEKGKGLVGGKRGWAHKQRREQRNQNTVTRWRRCWRCGCTYSTCFLLYLFVYCRCCCCCCCCRWASPSIWLAFNNIRISAAGQQITANESRVINMHGMLPMLCQWAQRPSCDFGATNAMGSAYVSLSPSPSLCLSLPLSSSLISDWCLRTPTAISRLLTSATVNGTRFARPQTYYYMYIYVWRIYWGRGVVML